MARPATGAVIPTKNGGWALRFTAYGKRRFVALGTEQDGWDRDRAEAELQNHVGGREAGALVPAHAGRRSFRPDGRTDLPRVRLGVVRREETRAVHSTAEAYLWHLRDHLLP